MMKKRKVIVGGLVAALLGLAPNAQASYAYYVGKNLTEDGVVLVGGTGEEVSSHWLEIVPRREYGDGETVKVGVTAEASIPGELTEIPQPAESYRYLSMFYSDYEGFPPPLTNGGVNEFQVAVRDVWAPSRDELVEMTETPQKGLQYSDLARLVMERAKTAREGVELIGQLIDEYGYATYGGNTHMIADPNEGWVVWEFAGSQGLWAAERLGPDDVRVLYPGYIEDFPLDYQDNPDYMGSDNLVSFAEEQGWFDAQGGEPFNVFEVYGSQDESAKARSGGFKFVPQADIEAALKEKAPVSEREMMAQVRDYRITDDEAGYGQVVSLKEGTPAPLIRIWVAPTGSVAAPFNPWWLGVQEVAPEYGQHRYLTKDAGATFLNPDFQMQEATEFAGRTFKRVLYYTCERPKTFRPAVQKLLVDFEAQSMSQVEWVEAAARSLLDADQTQQATSLLTYYANSRADEALEMGNAMTDWLDLQYALSDTLREPQGEAINDQGGETVNCLPDADPDKPASAQ